MKSFRPKGEADAPSPDRNAGAGRDFRGERRSNETQGFTTDPGARLYREAPGRRSPASRARS